MPPNSPLKMYPVHNRSFIDYGDIKNEEPEIWNTKGPRTRKRRPQKSRLITVPLFFNANERKRNEPRARLSGCRGSRFFPRSTMEPNLRSLYRSKVIIFQLFFFVYQFVLKKVFKWQPRFD